MSAPGIALTGWGAALPERVVRNADLERYLDTSDAWITERTGIRERRVGGTTTGLAVDAGRRALVRAGRSGGDVDHVLLATCTADQQLPASAATVQQQLGTTGGAADLNAACAGFVYALISAAGLVALGASAVLVVGAETLSGITDWDDRDTAVLFADGAGAVLVEAVEGPGQLLAWEAGCDGSARTLLDCDRGGTLRMDGRALFRRAVRATVDSAASALARAGLEPGDVSLFVPHQANVRIIDAAGQRLGIDAERTAVVVDRTGNTSAASIPLALADAADRGRLADGDVVLLTGFGAGMSWASAVLRWGVPVGSQP